MTSTDVKKNRSNFFIKKISWPLFEWISFLGIFIYILSNFSFFIPSYGDAASYSSYRWPPSFSYQPTFPFIVSFLKLTFNNRVSIYYFQSILFFITIIILKVLLKDVAGKAISLVSSIILLLNIRWYFYIANPLTEVTNLFLFFFFFYFLMKSNNYWGSSNNFLIKLGYLLVTFLILLALIFNRTSNIFFALILSLLLVLFNNHRKISIVIFLSFVTALSLHLIYNNNYNGLGLNLGHFILATCEKNDVQKCPEIIFNADKNSVIGKYWQARKSLKEIENEFNVWGKEYGDEMKAVYFRLLWYAPGVFLQGVLYNWEEQIVGTYFPPYPEDPNQYLLNTPLIGLLSKLSNVFAGSSILLIVFFVPIGIIYLIQYRAEPAVSLFLATLIAWIIGQFICTNTMFANLWISDATRMRLSYEMQSLLLILFVSKLIMISLRRQGAHSLPSTIT